MLQKKNIFKKILGTIINIELFLITTFPFYYKLRLGAIIL